MFVVLPRQGKVVLSSPLGVLCGAVNQQAELRAETPGKEAGLFNIDGPVASLPMQGGELQRRISQVLIGL